MVRRYRFLHDVACGTHDLVLVLLYAARARCPEGTTKATTTIILSLNTLESPEAPRPRGALASMFSDLSHSQPIVSLIDEQRHSTGTWDGLHSRILYARDRQPEVIDLPQLKIVNVNALSHYYKTH